MKNVTLFAMALMAMHTTASWAQDQVKVNLTPLPKEITVKQGSTLEMPQQFQISVNGLADSVKIEAERFAAVYTKVSGAQVKVVSEADPQALIQVNLNTGASKLGPEAYKLKITGEKIQIEAETTRGIFYAFQSLKKLLPPCVMAEVKDPAVTRFILPVVDIEDAPRFNYRGYMLDVCRHFFTVDEIKRILDVMSYYKMNKFHWHLTEDQAWRVEIKKYPKLTSVGSVREFAWNTEYKPGSERYRTYEPYGPFYYTQDQIKEVVKYAQDRHIDIIPEVDMPGHFSAAMASYPEFSCNPKGNHNIPCDGGIYSDILNVGNPQAVQFAKDIIGELMELFPYPYFHIGGDECPTTAWENNKECKELMKKLGFGNNYRKLQSWFIHELAEFAATKGRKLYVWNEAITANGADTEMIRKSGATVMCWTGAENAARKAASLGLNNVLTPQPTWYINRKAGNGPTEPHAVGNGNDATLSQVYNYNPGGDIAANVKKYYTGVQGTFWTEHVSEAPHVEYLTFPRLIAIAETGWSPKEKKNYQDFCNRMKQDTVLLNYNNYQYAPYDIKDVAPAEVVLPKTSSDENMIWYRLVTMAEGDRNDKCIELLREGASQIDQYKGDAQVNRLWSGSMVQEGDPAYDYQWWALKEDPNNKGHYALICKANPQGSINPQATKENNTGRWDYDPDHIHYAFTLNTKEFYGVNGDNYYYAIKSDMTHGNYWMNLAAGGQHYSVNLWNDPKDGNAGLWEFQPMDRDAIYGMEKTIAEAKNLLKHAQYYEKGVVAYGKYDAEKAEALKTAVGKESPVEAEVTEALKAFKASLGVPQNGDQIRITNAVEGSSLGLSISETEKGQLRTSDKEWGSDIWVVEAAEQGTFALKNMQSNQYIKGNSNPLTLGAEKATYKYSFNDAEHDFTIATSEGKALFPVALNYVTNPGCIYVDGVRPQGAAWHMTKVFQVKYECVDEKGNKLGTYYQAAEAGKDYTCQAPEIANYEVLNYAATKEATAPVIQAIAKNESVKVVYKRVQYALTLQYKDENGNLLGDSVAHCPLDAAVELKYPELKYYTFKEATVPAGSYTPTKDETIVVTYQTEAPYTGFAAVDTLVTALEDGKQYLFYNAAADGGRNGFINIDPSGKVLTTKVSEGAPAYVWSLKGKDNTFKVMASNDKFISKLPKGGEVVVGAQGDSFTFTLNSDHETWNIKGTNGYYWNGNAGSMTGWTDPHPYKIYSLRPVPYFVVKCSYVDQNGNAIASLSDSESIVKAGDAFAVSAPELKGYDAPVVSEDPENLKAVGQNLDIKIVYKKLETGIQEVEVEGKQDDKLYDLNGRILNRAQSHGVYIQNGQKVVK